MQRVTVKNVVDAYKETGYTPTSDQQWLDNGKKACPMTAIGISKGHVPMDWVCSITPYKVIADRLGLHNDYVAGFYKGYDLGEINTDNSKSAEYDRGVTDGIMVKNELALRFN